jgi:hypothetical protein
MEKEPEGEVEEEEPYHLLPEPKELEEDEEVPESTKELKGKVEEPDREEKELEDRAGALSARAGCPPCQSWTKRSKSRSFS